MTLQKIALGMVATVAALALTPALRADTHIAVSGFGATVGTPDGGIGFWIGRSAPARHYYHGPVYREYGRPGRDRFVRIGPPPVVVVRPPVVVAPVPPIIQDSTVTVWITNSNGSRTTVQLTRHNGWYIGPRGEYYDQMPTNEQLRLAYGF